MAATNSHRVPVKSWRKWTEHGRTVFNDTYEIYRNNQRLITHPKADPVPPRHWKTIAWNMAWLAADAASSAPARPGDRCDDITKSGRVTRQAVFQ